MTRHSVKRYEYVSSSVSSLAVGHREILLSTHTVFGTGTFNSSPPSGGYMRQWIGSTLVHIMACRRFGAKPLSQPILFFVSWTLRNMLQWNLYQFTNFPFTKMHLKISSVKRRPFSPGVGVGWGGGWGVKDPRNKMTSWHKNASCTTCPLWWESTDYGQYTGFPIDPCRRSHYTSNKYPKMHHFETRMCTHVLCRICEISLWWFYFDLIISQIRRAAVAQSCHDKWQ